MNKKAIMRDAPEDPNSMTARWYRHVVQVKDELAVKRPSRWRRIQDWLGLDVGGEIRGFARWLLDRDQGPVLIVADRDEINHVLSELSIVRTALAYHWFEPEQRERMIERLRAAELRLAGAGR